MAPPPKYILTRRLIKQYFEKNLPDFPSYLKLKELPIMHCWEKYGPGDIKCDQYQEDFDNFFNEINRFRNDLKTNHPMKTVMKQLNRPRYPVDSKGKNRRYPYEKSIYDGIL